MSFGFPIDEVDDIPPKFDRGPSTLYTIMSMLASIDVIKETIDITTIVV